jgi:tetratricopeptide (TPR) repeat protein
MIVRYKGWLACCGCVALGAMGSWALQRWHPDASAGGPRPAHADAAAPEEPADVLAAIPRGPGRSKTDQAIARASDKAQRTPDAADSWADLGDALMQKARETADAAYYTHAERAYRRALALQPRQPDAVVGMAWVTAGRHEFEQTVEWANKAVAQNPRDPRGHGLLGDAAVEMGDYDAAVKHFQKMLDLRPDLSSYSRAAHVLFLRGDVRRAGWLMRKAVECGAPYAENTAWALAQLALIYFSDGHLMAAEQALEEAKGRAADNVHVLAALGKVKAARHDCAGAIACYQKASAIVPRHDVLAALGDLYRLQGNAAEADKQFALVEATHRLNKANGVRGDAQLALFWADHDRNLPEALQMAEEEYKTRKNVFVADTLAWCLYKNGRYEAARRAARQALAWKTPDAGFLFHSGMIHEKLGDRHTAQLHLYQALSLNPNFSPVFAPQAADAIRQLGSTPPAEPAARR